jgi:GNAT superfamily N-acetyltransferase
MVKVFSSSEPLLIPNLVSSYRLFKYSSEYKQQWIQLFNTSREFGHWNEDRFEEEMLEYLIPGSEFLLADQQKIIGSCAAFYLLDYQPYAVLAYPVVLQEYRNQGIGKFLILHTLVSCQDAGYPGVLLHTDDYRSAAVNVYLQLGFQPIPMTVR